MDSSSDQQDVKQAESARADTTDKGQTVPYERFKEVNDTLKELKKQLSEREAADRKAAEEKAIEEGKLKEVFTQAKAESEKLAERNKGLEEQHTRLRKNYLKQLTDEVDKSVAEDIQDIDKLAKFVQARSAQKPEGPADIKGKAEPGEFDPFAVKGGWDAVQKALRDKGLGV